MKRVFAQAGQPVVRDVEEPSPRAGEVLVDTHYSTVSSGTESLILRRSLAAPELDQEYPGSDPHWPHIRDGAAARLLPRPAVPGGIALGYSAAGVVREVGEGVRDIVPGMRVACSGSQCAHHAQVIAVPRHLVAPLPDGLSLRQGAFVTLGSIAVEALRKSDCRFGETVVVYGLGLLGLLAAQIAKAAGLRVVGFDINPRALALARELGVPDVHDPRESAADEAVRRGTGGFGADAVLLTAVNESSEPFNHALNLCRQRGVVVCVGVFGMTIDRDRLAANDVSIRQAIAYGPGRYDPSYEEDGVDYPIGLVRWTENRNMAYFLDLLAEGRVAVLPLAPEPIPIAEAPRGYALLAGPDRPPTVQFRHHR
jgi:threonine dehydrogenase-like Zn-dependent dehydrogenase